MRILVTGASGFVGSALIPRLLQDGHDLRAIAREPSRVTVAGAHVLRGDVLTGEGLAEALDGVEVAYYLIHSMERSAGARPPAHRQGARGHDGGRQAARLEEFSARERIGAQRFASAAAKAGVSRIVYLGGLLPRGEPMSRHLASRAAVEKVLLDAVPGSVALRASIVIGARSRSFRLLVRLVERMPVLALPAWRHYRTQPIDERDVTEMLALAADASALAGLSLDIGGPDVLTYEEVLRRIAQTMLVHRPTLGLNVSVTPIAARVAAAIAQEDPELVQPLMESLAGDLLPADDRAVRLLEVPLHSFDAAVEHALAEWERVEPLAAR